MAIGKLLKSIIAACGLLIVSVLGPLILVAGLCKSLTRHRKQVRDPKTHYDRPDRVQAGSENKKEDSGKNQAGRQVFRHAG